MGEGHKTRWGGLAGIGSVVFAITARTVTGPMPQVTSPAGMIVMYLARHRAHIMWGAVLYAVAIVLFLWFGAALSAVFRRADETGDASTVVLAGFILISTTAFMAVSVFAGVTWALTEYRALLLFAPAPYATMTVVGTVVGIATALTLAATAVAIARTHVFGRWMAWFTGLVALVRLLASLTLGVTDGPLVPGGWLERFVPNVLLALWVLTASGLLILRHLPAARGPARHRSGPRPAGPGALDMDGPAAFLSARKTSRIDARSGARMTDHTV